MLPQSAGTARGAEAGQRGVPEEHRLLPLRGARSHPCLPRI